MTVTPPFQPPRPKEPNVLTHAEWKAISDTNLDAADVLLAAGGFPSHAVYLAGFAVETAIKGRCIEQGINLPERTHSLWDLLLRCQLLRPCRETTLPPDWLTGTRSNLGLTDYWQLFVFLGSNWDNQIRYSVPAVTNSQEFVHAARDFVGWLWTA